MLRPVRLMEDGGQEEAIETEADGKSRKTAHDWDFVKLADDGLSRNYAGATKPSRPARERVDGWPGQYSWCHVSTWTSPALIGKLTYHC